MQAQKVWNGYICLLFCAIPIGIRSRPAGGRISGEKSVPIVPSILQEPFRIAEYESGLSAAAETRELPRNSAAFSPAKAGILMPTPQERLPHGSRSVRLPWQHLPFSDGRSRLPAPRPRGRAGRSHRGRFGGD